MVDSGSNPSNDLPPRLPGKQENRAFSPGETFDHYRIKSCLSLGHVAHYYRAQHVRQLSDVTLVVLHPRIRQNDTVLERLRDLAQKLKGVKSASVLKILDILVTDTHYALVYEFAASDTLTRYFESQQGDNHIKGLPVRRVNEIISGLLTTLGQIHAAGLCHLDLDSNTLFYEPGKDVACLGAGLREAIGRELFEQVTSAIIAPLANQKPSCRVTTMEVLSPEFKRGEEEDARADLYAVGVIGYWLLTGEKPGRGDVVLPSKINPEISDGWNAFLMRCLEREVDDRFSSVRGATGALKSMIRDREKQQPAVGRKRSLTERVPVPKPLRARGDRASKLFAVSLIGVVGALLLALVLELGGLLGLGDGGGRPALERVDADAKYNLTLQLKPARAMVEFSGLGERFAVTQGRADFKIEPGTYDLRVSAPEYQTRELKLVVNDKEPREIDVSLVPTFGSVVVQSDPGVSVIATAAEGKRIELGTTDAEGQLPAAAKLPAGSYDFVFSKPGFKDFVLEAQTVAGGGRVELSAQSLEANPALVTVTSEPPGATVRVNGYAVGQTPTRLQGLPIGERLEVTLELEGYRGQSRSFELDHGEQRPLAFGELEKQRGRAVLELTFDGQAANPERLDALELRVNGERTAFRPGAELEVPAGENEWVLTHPDYREERIVFEVDDGGRVERKVDLLPKPGRLVLDLEEGIEFSLKANGRLVAVPGRNLGVPADRDLELELSVRDFKPVRRSLRLGPNETATWSIELEPLPGPVRGETWMVPYLEMQMVWVPAGQFTMGSPATEVRRLPNEGPLTDVIFEAGFWVAAEETTQGSYRALVGDNPSAFDDPRFPVETVSWMDARAYCEALTAREREAGRLPENMVYRLPTEAEWEYFARAGTTTAFSFGAEATPADGNFKGVYPPRVDAALSGDERYGPLAVGSFPANDFGIFDVHGNVSEWTADTHAARHPDGTLRNPVPRRQGNQVTARGGSWEDNAIEARSASRVAFSPQTLSDSVGFRVVLASEHITE